MKKQTENIINNENMTTIKTQVNKTYNEHNAYILTLILGFILPISFTLLFFISLYFPHENTVTTGLLLIILPATSILSSLFSIFTFTKIENILTKKNTQLLNPFTSIIISIIPIIYTMIIALKDTLF